jgi:Uma2 family endonuclease
MTSAPSGVVAPPIPQQESKATVKDAYVPMLRRFTADEYERMIETAILRDDERCELIGGVIIAMSPLGSLHVACVNRAAKLFIRLVQDSAIVSVQNAFRLDEKSRPQPDLAIIRQRDDDYDMQLPGAEDVLLLIEVSDTTIDFDRNEKAARYAAAGIPECWIVDLQNQLIEAHTSPADGIYHNIKRATRGETLTPQYDAMAIVSVIDILGKARS